MQPQKFDPTKPHGTVWGHSSAQYIQNGVMYDASGCLIDVEENEESTESSSDNSKEKEFLLRILNGGPVFQSLIKRDSEIENLIWSDVVAAGISIGIEKVKSGVSNTWQLPRN